MGNRSPVESRLMDAIGDWLAEHDPGAEAVPTVLPAFTDCRWFRDRVPGLRRLRLLPAAPPDGLRDLAADARQGRAHRRPRPRLRRRVLPRPPREAVDLMPVPKDKLRLGGMALRNGLLVHGPTHWAAAVRTKAGDVKVASGPKPRVHARRRRPRPARARPPRRGVRGHPARQAGPARGQAGVRAAERARRRRRRVDRGHAAAPPRARDERARSRRRSSRSRPRCSRCAAASWPPTTASSTRRSPPTRPTTRTRATRRRSTSAAART